MTSRLSGTAAGPSVLCALSFATLLVCGTERAAAHDPPTGTGVYVRGEQLVVRTPRGLVVSRGRDLREFVFVCNEALGVADFDVPSVLLQADQSMLVGTSAGLVRVSPDLCAIDTLPAFGGARVTALVRASNQSPDVYAATDAGLFVSSDDAQTFSAQNSTAFDSLELTRDNVVYATGRYPSPRTQPRVYFARWRKDGLLEQHELMLEPTEVGISLLGSDPRRTLRVFAAAHAYLGTQYLDRFLVSDDGAQTWTTPFAAASIAAFAIDPTTGDWLAGAASGLWRASGEQPPKQVSAAAVSCLAFASKQLYVCDGLGSEGGLSLSADGGNAWSSVFRFNQVAGLSACPAESKAVQPCQMAWADWTREMPPGPPLTGSEARAARDAGAASDLDEMQDAAPSRNVLSSRNNPSSCAAVSGTRFDTHAAWRWSWSWSWSWLLPTAALLHRQRRRQRSSNKSTPT